MPWCYLPTKVILGCAGFLTTIGLDLAAAAPIVVGLAVTEDAAAAAAAAIFTGSVDGMGLPSLVWSFSTCE